MSQKRNNHQPSRRKFLYGAGGFALALPFLPSLLSREARAATAPKRFVFVGSNHGGIRPQYLFPAIADGTNNGGTDNPLSEFIGGARKNISMQAASSNVGHSIRQGSLAGLLYSQNGKTGISPVLSVNNSQILPANIVEKMHLYQGLDIPYYYGHHAGMLGNFADNSGTDANRSRPFVPSIDQILANSKIVYPAGSAPAANLVNAGVFGESFSYTYANTEGFTNNNPSQGGSINPFSATMDLGPIFDSLFGGFTPGAQAPTQESPHVLVVDRVLASWNSLKNGAFGDARRLSKEDSNRIQGFIQNMYQIQTKIKGQSGGGATNASCVKPSLALDGKSLNPYVIGFSQAARVSNAKLLNDIMAAALACDRTRVAIISFYNWDGFEYAERSHEEVWHMAHEADQQRKMVGGMQVHFDCIADLAYKINSYADASGTVLDNSMVMWSHMSGPDSHDNDSTPVIAFGGLGGKFKTNTYYDYRNHSARGYFKEKTVAQPYRKPGILYGQMLVSIMQAFGLTPNDYSKHNLNRPGYADSERHTYFKGDWGSSGFGISDATIAQAGSTLPLAYMG